jgi:hypothetical protein
MEEQQLQRVVVLAVLAAVAVFRAMLAPVAQVIRLQQHPHKVITAAQTIMLAQIMAAAVVVVLRLSVLMAQAQTAVMAALAQLIPAQHTQVAVVAVFMPTHPTQALADLAAAVMAAIQAQPGLQILAVVVVVELKHQTPMAAQAVLAS